MKNQRGMSLFGFLIVLALVGFVAITAIKIVPAYIEFRGVKQAMDAVVQVDGKAKGASSAKIREALDKRLGMNYVAGVKASDIKITPVGRGFRVSIEYQTERTLLGNLYILAKFKHEAETSDADETDE